MNLIQVTDLNSHKKQKEAFFRLTSNQGLVSSKIVEIDVTIQKPSRNQFVGYAYFFTY